MRLLAALLLPTEGTIEIEGLSTVEKSEEIHEITSYMPQKFGLYEDLTVLENLNLYADLKGVLGSEKKASFERLLTFTGLEPFQERLAGALSGGMKQKLGLACALIKKPKVLLLDEPSVGVDPISRRELWKMVYELIGEGITVLWSTAYLDEAEKCHTVLVLNEGKLIYSGAPADLSQKVEGRVFLVKNVKEDRRALLFDLLEQKPLVDATIKGRDLHLVTLEKGVFTYRDCIIEPVAPSFEDGFMDKMGGIHRKRSMLAEKAPFVKNDHAEMIVAEGLTKKFGDFVAADHISFRVKKGEVFGLLGPNGAGKSTTFKMLCGLLKPTEGSVFVAGFDSQKAKLETRLLMGYMAQKFSLYGNLSVLQNLIFFSGIYRLNGAVQKEAIDEMIELFELKPYLNTNAEMLPLGFKQRLALACANMHHPSVLFLDEATSGVDPITRREFWSHINGLVGKGVTIMVTTHFMEEAEYCDRVALVYKGKIIALESPDGLKEGVKTKENPTLEDAFIAKIGEYDALHAAH